MSSYLIPILTCLLFYALGYFYGKNYIYRDTKRKTKKIKKFLSKQSINPKKLNNRELTELFKRAKIGFIVEEKEEDEEKTLKNNIKTALEEEDYEEAAKLRDELKQLRNKKP